MNTRIIATIGPSSFNKECIKSLVEAGVSVLRINTKYASRDEVLELKRLMNGLDCELLIDVLDTRSAKKIMDLECDYIALSFTETAEQVKDLKKVINPDAKVISKIETVKGVNNITNLIKASDGLMIARGDLGEHVPLEQLPFFQKEIIKECNESERFVITATEMLLSMTKHKTPTKGEVSDVANAVLDGSNALMLSEETAIGKHPVLAVEVMSKIIKEAEKYEQKIKK